MGEFDVEGIMANFWPRIKTSHFDSSQIFPIFIWIKLSCLQVLLQRASFYGDSCCSRDPQAIYFLRSNPNFHDASNFFLLLVRIDGDLKHAYRYEATYWDPKRCQEP